jgi:hypothetical protein
MEAPIVQGCAPPHLLAHPLLHRAVRVAKHFGQVQHEFTHSCAASTMRWAQCEQYKGMWHGERTCFTVLVRQKSDNGRSKFLKKTQDMNWISIGRTAAILHKAILLHD